MDLGFRGEIVEYYHRFRPGYRPAVIDALVAAFDLTRDDVVVDLGCGTGQLTLPVAERVRAVVGVDPEPDMLARARRAATEQGTPNVTWVLGADEDLGALGGALGGGIGAVTVAQALHWMDHDRLFRRLAPLVRPGGGVAVVTNGTPLWLQDTAWSRALGEHLQQWLGHGSGSACGTDAASQERYRRSMAASGFDVHGTAVEHSGELSVEDIVGGVCSALPVDLLPAPDQRPQFAERIRHVVEPHAPFTERVRVALLIGRAGPARSG